MESIISKLGDSRVWLEYFEYKRAKQHLHKREEAKLADFINSQGYADAAGRIQSGEGIGLPTKILINKIGGKKRTVYTYRDDENIVLKLLSYLLYRYDDRHCPLCYSFRKGVGAKNAIYRLIGTPGINNMWCYKLDIKDYFNSISIPLMLPLLLEVICDDEPLFRFFEQMLSGDEAIFGDAIIRENRGVMAGTPTSPFLANVYLREADTYFAENNILYARYSDDIIIFADSEAELLSHRDIMRGFIERYKLTVNPAKEYTSAPGQPWEYLGVEYRNGVIDLSPVTKKKIKGKIKRKARALRRWMIRKNATGEQVMKVMIRVFNRKFFESRDKHDLTWSRWFFPLVTVKDGFAEIDAYLQQYIRYIPTGRFCKTNYNVTYEMLKSMGYRSLVNEYFSVANLRK